MMDRMMLRRVGGSLVGDFIITINTTLGDGLNQMRLPIQGTDPMDIDWGDGTTETVTQTAPPSSANWVTHSYASAGVYDIAITNLEYIRFGNQGDSAKPTEVKSWGGSEWNVLSSSFSGCTNIDVFDTPMPEWLNVTNLVATWRDCTSLITAPDVSNLVNVTNLQSTWQGCSSLTTAPDVSALVNVTNLVATWADCSSLAQLPLIGFHIENVTNASFMAVGVTATNYDAILVDFEARLESLYPSGVGYPNTGLDIHFGNSKYTIGSAAETARTSLINNFGWVITDGGGI